jgi:molybdenum cofactor synthesis domain-containing protein
VAETQAENGIVISVNVSERQGTSKQPVAEIVIDEHGIKGDAHAGDWHRQVSLLASESIERFSTKSGRTFGNGEFAENITTRGIDLLHAAFLDRFRVGPSAELEVTQIGKECHGQGCAIFQQVGRCVMPKEGIFCRVIRGGPAKAGDAITYVPRVLHCRVITLSDRASQGIYADRSGPRIVQRLEEFGQERRWRLDVSVKLLPDDTEMLREELLAARDAGVQVVFTTGGTGIGPRDISPEVVAALADKIIPGVMEHIRLKYGAEKPAALLSRSIAAVMGGTLVYALPGSVKAVDEYMTEILKTLEHSIYMLRGVDAH